MSTPPVYASWTPPAAFTSLQHQSRFINPPSFEFKQATFSNVMRWQFTRTKPKYPSAQEADQHLPVKEPNVPLMNKIVAQQKSEMKQAPVSYTWLGHSTVLVQLGGHHLLTDPVFEERCGPVIAPKRIRPICTRDSLPLPDMILISHSHYDHLELSSVQHYGNKVTWFVPKGLETWFHALNITNVIALDWWETVQFKETALYVTCTPAKHWCARTPFDRNKYLWAGFMVHCVTHDKKFYYTGDTGHVPELFKTIGERYGPMDLSAIPIGAYHPRWFMAPQHIDPQQAVEIHKLVKSRHTLAVHWGTFLLADEEYLAPQQELEETLKQENEIDFVTRLHGETHVLE